MPEKYDVAIIGSGPGGYIAGIRAAQLGFKTVCIEKEPVLGGTCLHVGCIPSKTLLHATETYFHLQQHGHEQGIEYEHLSINFPQMMTRKKQVVDSLAEGIFGLFRKNRVISMTGIAEFINSHTLKIKQKDNKEIEIEATYIIIASGSEPIPLPIIPFDEKQIVSSTGALRFLEIPKRLVVIGGGVIGVELSSVYQRLGSQVTIVEMLDCICPTVDRQLSNGLLQILKKQGIQFKLSTQLISAVQQPDEVILTVNENGKLANLSATHVLVAIGRRPVTTGLQIEKAEIEIDDKGFILIDDRFRTKQPHIFAIGDVVKGPMLAHRASAEAIAVVESLKDGSTSSIQYVTIPNVVYTSPEMAVVGLTQEEAEAGGLRTLTSVQHFRANPRARCTCETEGLVKIVCEKDSYRLLGIHILGPHASELIAQGVLALQKKMTIRDLAYAVQAHPTLSEAIKEAAEEVLRKT